MYFVVESELWYDWVECSRTDAQNDIQQDNHEMDLLLPTGIFKG